MGRVIFLSVAYLALPYFLISHKRHDFRKKKISTVKYNFLFSLEPLSEEFLILRRADRGIIISVYRSPCKVPVILV